MRTHRYVLLQSESEAHSLIEKIDQGRGTDHWAEPNINPFDGRALVPWNDEYLMKEVGLIEGMQTLTHDEAQDEGWAFGYFAGRFSKVRIKLEEAQHIRISLDAFDRKPNYPAYRALFFGLLSSLYAVKEALRRASGKIGNDASEWWREKFEEINTDPLLWLFYDLNNSDKHSISSQLLRPRMNLYGYKGAAPPRLIISGEGVFQAVDRGTARERRIFFEGPDAAFEVYLDIPTLTHKGQDVSDIGLKSQLDLAIAHYEQLVFEAGSTFDGGI